MGLANTNFAYTGCDNLEVMADAINYNNFLISCIERYVSSKKTKVLDFGAGSGTYADMLREKQIMPDCLEPDKKLQTILKSKGYRIVDAKQATNKDTNYDIIYALNVFEHLKNDQEISEELASLLNKDGKLIIYVPAFEALFSSMDEKVEHYRRYRKSQLERILRNAGLEIIESRYCDPAGFFATLAYKMFGKDDGTISPKALRFYDRAVFPVSKLSQIFTQKMIGKNVLVVATKKK
jgi:SAM-dependent methyltransferase